MNNINKEKADLHESYIDREYELIENELKLADL